MPDPIGYLRSGSTEEDRIAANLGREPGDIRWRLHNYPKARLTIKKWAFGEVQRRFPKAYNEVLDQAADIMLKYIRENTPIEYGAARASFYAITPLRGSGYEASWQEAQAFQSHTVKVNEVNQPATTHGAGMAISHSVLHPLFLNVGSPTTPHPRPVMREASTLMKPLFPKLLERAIHRKLRNL